MSTNLNVLPYWIAVGEQEKELRASLSRGEHGALHPVSDDAVYLVSRENKLKRIVPGRTMLAKVRHAARTLVDMTHSIANDQQIRDFQAEQARTRDLILKQEASAKSPTLNFAPAVSVYGPGASQGGK